MHKLIQIEKALKLLNQYGGQSVKTSRELGINKHTLRSWQNKKGKRTSFERKRTPSFK